MSMLIATDLDRTLIYSHAAVAEHPAAPPLRCVETYDGEPASFMTEHAAQLLIELATYATVVPVTTRIRRQYERVVLPVVSSYAVVANGGQLLIDGRSDSDWERLVRERLTACVPLPEIWRHLTSACSPRWTSSLREADGLFCYAVVRPAQLPPGFIADTAEWARERGWRVSMQGRKIYWMPEPLTKAAAIAEIATRIGARTVLAAGDSLLDIDLLLAADLGIHPAHGELFDAGWHAPGVVRTTQAGVVAGEQIVSWFLAQATGGKQPRPA